MTSGRDILLSGTSILQRAILRAGNENTQLIVFEGLPHAFWNDALPESRKLRGIWRSFSMKNWENDGGCGGTERFERAGNLPICAVLRFTLRAKAYFLARRRFMDRIKYQHIAKTAAQGSHGMPCGCGGTDG